MSSRARQWPWVLAALGATAAGAAALTVSVLGGGGQRPTAGWTPAQAADRITTAPPAAWTRRHWDIAYVLCDGLGSPQLRDGRRSYTRFSCEVTVVAPSRDCASIGSYACVAAFDSSVLERTLRVLGADRYALS